MEWAEGEYLISNDQSKLSLETVCGFLSRTYWAEKRPPARIAASLGNSMCFGVYHDDKQVGFARVVTDRATMYWLCDVFIAEEYRGKGLGKRLIRCVVECDELQNLVGILGTRDAHGLYEQFGFKRDQNRFMRRAPDELGASITDSGGR